MDTILNVLIQEMVYFCLQRSILMCFDLVTEQLVPAMYILLNSKCQQIYSQAFTLIQEILDNEERDASDRIKSCTLDFEKSLHLAFRQSFKTGSVIGCLFHFRQSLYRKGNELSIMNDTNFKYFVDALTGIKIKER